MTIDHSSWWWRKGRAAAVIAGTLLVAGVVLQPLQNSAWAEVRSRQPELNLRDLKDTLGQGTLIGVLGGFREILADFVWIRKYDSWEKRDAPATEALLDLTTKLEPRVVLFWDEGSREIGYDIPAWPRRDQNRPPPTDAEMQQLWNDQANRALKFLDDGLKFNPDSYQLLFDKAQIYQTRLNDIPRAAEQYRLAAASSDAPYWAARIYVRLLCDMKKYDVAYQYLRTNLYFNLPADNPDAQKFVIWDWILALENKLDLPASRRLPASAAPAGWKPPANADEEFYAQLPGLTPDDPPTQP